MLTIGSRGSALALWQAHHVQSLLLARGIETRIAIIKTTGDRVQNVPISTLGSKGVFTKEIEDALAVGEIDLAVHSLKDMLTVLPEGLCLAASPAREDPRDALAGKKLADLRQSAVVGTSSLRRATQLRALRPDLDIREIRGNVDTRLRKLAEGQYEAIMLASAGLRRLNLSHHIAEDFPVESMTPAPGQGALGIETRLDGPGFEAARSLNDEAVWTAVTAERAVLAALGGGCQVPVGAYADVSGGKVRLRAVIAKNGSLQREAGEVPVADAHALGFSIGERLK